MSTDAINSENLTRRPRIGRLAMFFYAVSVIVMIALAVDVRPFANSHSNLAMAQTKSAQLDIGAIFQAVDLFGVVEGHLPATLNELVPQYIRDIHKDPWGGDYQFEVHGDQYAIISLGKSQNPDRRDAIISRGTFHTNSQQPNQKRPSP